MAKALIHDGSNGAPNAPIQLQRWVDDQLVNVPGIYRPDRATPVGGDGQISLDLAKELADDPNVPLKLIDLSDSEAEVLSGKASEDLAAARRGVVAAKKEDKAKAAELTKGLKA